MRESLRSMLLRLRQSQDGCVRLPRLPRLLSHAAAARQLHVSSEELTRAMILCRVSPPTTCDGQPVWRAADMAYMRAALFLAAAQSPLHSCPCHREFTRGGAPLVCPICQRNACLVCQRRIPPRRVSLEPGMMLAQHYEAYAGAAAVRPDYVPAEAIALAPEAARYPNCLLAGRTATRPWGGPRRPHVSSHEMGLLLYRKAWQARLRAPGGQARWFPQIAKLAGMRLACTCPHGSPCHLDALIQIWREYAAAQNRKRYPYMPSAEPNQ